MLVVGVAFGPSPLYKLLCLPRGVVSAQGAARQIFVPSFGAAPLRLWASVGRIMIKALFRLDASSRIGAGHAMRCLALAEEMRAQGWNCAILAVELTDAVRRRFDAEGIDCLLMPGPIGSQADAEATLRTVESIGSSVLVVDGYDFGRAWWNRLGRPDELVVVAMDDNVEKTPLPVDVVVNAAGAEHRSLYLVRTNGAQLLLGSAYTLLRAEIRAAAAETRIPLGERRQVLVTFGGSDPAGLTLPVVRALDSALPENVRIAAVVGGSVPAAGDVAAACRAISSRVDAQEDVRTMGRLIAQSGLVVTAAGSTVGEVFALGVPSIVIPVAPNQVEGAQLAAANGGSLACEPDPYAIATAAITLWNDESRRAAMEAAAGQVVDLSGAKRIVAAIQSVLMT